MMSRIINFIDSHKLLLFFIIIGLQIVFLLGMAATKVIPAFTATRILLKPVPIDPDELFRGKYVRLRYDISNVRMDRKPRDGEEIEVLLIKADRFWSVERVIDDNDDLSSQTRDRIIIKGKAVYSYNDRTSGSYNVTVEYGIESWFVSEKDAPRYERLGSRNLEVEAAIDSWGNASIARVFANGKPVGN